MALADGKIVAFEQKIISSIAERMNYLELDVKVLIKRERAIMYQEAKQFFRASR